MMNDEFLYLWAQWGILNARQIELMLKHFGSFKRGWEKVNADFLMKMGLRQEKAQRVMAIREQLSFAWLQEQMALFEVNIYHKKDEAYPAFLKEIESAPPFLFVRGKLASFHKSISVVGTRKVTDYGARVTRKLTADLVREGFVIVSGLAMGVDTLAHQTTLNENGMTVGVLGSGVDVIYPASNHRLVKNILESGGAVISAYPLGTPALAHHFPERNEIVAGLSKGTLVIEGGVKSGALITARLALEYGREVFAVPAPITHLALSGTNHLIRKSAAKLVENAEHILEEFNMQPGLNIQPQEFDGDERKLLERLMNGGKSVDELMDEMTLDIPQLSELLLQLNLKGAVAQQGDRWVLA